MAKYRPSMISPGHGPQEGFIGEFRRRIIIRILLLDLGPPQIYKCFVRPEHIRDIIDLSRLKINDPGAQGQIFPVDGTGEIMVLIDHAQQPVIHIGNPVLYLASQVKLLLLCQEILDLLGGIQVIGIGVAMAASFRIWFTS